VFRPSRGVASERNKLDKVCLPHAVSQSVNQPLIFSQVLALWCNSNAKVCVSGMVVVGYAKGWRSECHKMRRLNTPSLKTGNAISVFYIHPSVPKFPTFIDLLPQTAPRRWVVTQCPINHTRTQIFQAKCPFISVAHPIKRDKWQTIIINFNAPFGPVFTVPVFFGWAWLIEEKQPIIQIKKPHWEPMIYIITLLWCQVEHYGFWKPELWWPNSQYSTLIRMNPFRGRTLLS